MEDLIMDARLKKEMIIRYFDGDGDLCDVTLQQGYLVDIRYVSEKLATEVVVFKDYEGLFYINTDKIPEITGKYYLVDVQDIILSFDDFEADVNGTLNRLCKDMGVTQEQIDRVANMSQQERSAMLNKMLEDQKQIHTDMTEIREDLQK